MSSRPLQTLILTSLAPAVWGTTYVVTSLALPVGHPLGLAAMRALPAGLILLLVTRTLPRGHWWGRAFGLGALNFTVFWTLLFVAAYRLPGGVAATLGALQPLLVIVLDRLVRKTPMRAGAVAAGVAGMVGVGMIVLSPHAALDLFGVAAGLAAALSMATGTVLTRHWGPSVPPLTLTAWQLTAGGLLLLPLAVILEPTLPALSLRAFAGIGWLGLVGAALTYPLWFRGIATLGPNTVAPLGFLSPITAMIAGWLILGQTLSAIQLAGAGLALASIAIAQRVQAAQTRVSGSRELLTHFTDHLAQGEPSCRTAA